MFCIKYFDEWFYKGELSDANCGRNVNSTELYSATTTTMLPFNLMWLHQQQAIYKSNRRNATIKTIM